MLTNFSPTKRQALVVVTPPRTPRLPPTRRPSRCNPTRFGRHQPHHSATIRYLPNHLTIPDVEADSIPPSDIVEYVNYLEEENDEENDQLFERKNEARNTAMAYYYRYVLQAPSEDLWDGKDGVISTMITIFKLPNTHHGNNRRSIRILLKEVRKCVSEGRIYKGFTDRKWGKSSLLTSGSKEEHIIADWMEQGLGFRWTTMMVNHYRREVGLTIVGRNAVMYAFHRMKPTVTRIKKRSQGNVNHAAWQEGFAIYYHARW